MPIASEVSLAIQKTVSWKFYFKIVHPFQNNVLLLLIACPLVCLVHTSYLHNKAKEIIKPANLLECTELNM
jgi:hypothetical protein